jgi:hypothetical protein
MKEVLFYSPFVLINAGLNASAFAITWIRLASI